jgi:hypothetical protein
LREGNTQQAYEPALLPASPKNPTQQLRFKLHVECLSAAPEVTHPDDLGALEIQFDHVSREVVVGISETMEEDHKSFRTRSYRYSPRAGIPDEIGW